jgi:hypothetical protein
MSRPDPFNPNDGCGDGGCRVYTDGLIDKVYNLWNRNPVQVTRTYMTTHGKNDQPVMPNLTSF